MVSGTAVPTVPFGRTGMQITRVGFGAWAVGGTGWSGGWGPQDDSESIAAIRHAVERGVNWIDTAWVYGYGQRRGRSRRVGGVLGRRSSVRLHQVRPSRARGAYRGAYGVR